MDKFTVYLKQNIGYAWLLGTTLGCILLCYGFYETIAKPQLDLHEKMTADINLERAQVTSLENFLQAHPDLPQYLQELDRQVLVVNQMLPDQPEMGIAIKLVEKAADETNVVLGSSTTVSSAASEKWTETSVVVKVLGNYADLLNFAKRIDNGQRFMAVKAVDFHNRLPTPRSMSGPEMQNRFEKDLASHGFPSNSQIAAKGLLDKSSLVIMDVYFTIVTNGRLPGVEGVQPVGKTPDN